MKKLRSCILAIGMILSFGFGTQNLRASDNLPLNVDYLTVAVALSVHFGSDAFNWVHSFLGLNPLQLHNSAIHPDAVQDEIYNLLRGVDPVFLEDLSAQHLLANQISTLTDYHGINLLEATSTVIFSVDGVTVETFSGQQFPLTIEQFIRLFREYYRLDANSHSEILSMLMTELTRLGHHFEYWTIQDAFKELAFRLSMVTKFAIILDHADYAEDGIDGYQLPSFHWSPILCVASEEADDGDTRPKKRVNSKEKSAEPKKKESKKNKNKDSKCNKKAPKKDDKSPSHCAFRVSPHSTPHAAIMSFYTEDGLILDCCGSVVTSAYASVATAEGPDSFNQLVGTNEDMMTIAPFNVDTFSSGSGLTSSVSFHDNHPIFEFGILTEITLDAQDCLDEYLENLLPGDIVYFFNDPSYEQLCPLGIGAGEYCVYLGWHGDHQLFQGLGTEAVSCEDMIQGLEAQYQKDVKKECPKTEATPEQAEEMCSTCFPSLSRTIYALDGAYRKGGKLSSKTRQPSRSKK